MNQTPIDLENERRDRGVGDLWLIARYDRQRGAHVSNDSMDMVVDCSGLDAVDAQGLRTRLTTGAQAQRTRWELTVIKAPSWLLTSFRASEFDVGLGAAA